MELKIYSPSEDGFVKEIKWNHQEIKQEVARTVSFYKGLVYTDGEIKDAKADRAKLNKFVKTIDDKRKEIKKQCMEPYDSFEKQVKEIIAIVQEPIGMIDSQIKEYEAQKKAEKLQTITEYWNSLEKPFPIPIEKIMNDRWLNASMPITTVYADMDGKTNAIKKDYQTVQALPEFAFEATEVYKDTLDIQKAILEGRRLSDIAKRKAEEERKKAEAERIAAEQEAQRMALEQERQSIPLPEEICDDPVTSEQETINYEKPAFWVRFQALMTVEQAKELKEFFLSRNIDFRPL